MRILALLCLGACAPGYVVGFESGQVGRGITGPIVGASMQDLWAPLVDDGMFGHYDGAGWAVSGGPATDFGHVAAAEGLWFGGQGLFLATPGGVVDHTADLLGPPAGATSVNLQGASDGSAVTASLIDADTAYDDLALSSVQGGVVTPLLTLTEGYGRYTLIAATGPEDAYLTSFTGLHRLRDGALTDVVLPGWDTTQAAPRIFGAAPDDAWTWRVSVDAEGALLVPLYHDDGTGFVEVPVVWDHEALGGIQTLLPLPGGEVIVLSSRITASSWEGPDDGSGYGYQLNDLEMYATHVFVDGRVSRERIVFQCTPDPGQPPCSVYPGSYGVLADGTLVMLSSELLWWHGPIDAL
jgi:hypothetical protein